MSPEKPLTLSDVFSALDRNFSENLTSDRRMDPKDSAREMQKAAFGEDAMEVTDAQYAELISMVREIRPWLSEKGRRDVYHPGLDGTEHEIFSLEEESNDCRFLISFEPRPWEQSAKHKEPYPKFSVAYENPERTIEIRLNFDNTYELTIRNKKALGIPFEASGLRRKHMTANEYEVVKYAIGAVTSHFGIPVSIDESRSGMQLLKQERIESSARLIQTFQDARARIPEIQDQGNEGGKSIQRGESLFLLNFLLCGSTHTLSISRFPQAGDPIVEESCHIVLFHGYRGNIEDAKIKHKKHWRTGNIDDENINNQTAIEKIENLISQL